MAAAVFATLFVAMTPAPAVSPAPLSPEMGSFLQQHPAGLRLAASNPIHTRLAPETPGCANTGLSGRWSHRQRVSATPEELPMQGGAKQQARPRMENPVQVLQTLRPAMHMCVVDQFDPADTAGAGKTVYHL
jgi:hypothetical protein